MTDDNNSILVSDAGSNVRYIKLDRKVTEADVRKQRLKMMPGFRFKWYYSGKDVNPVANYQDEIKTQAFVRNGSKVYCTSLIKRQRLKINLKMGKIISKE